MSAPLEIFCCYAHEDQEMLEHLKKHLMPLQRSKQIKVWSDINITAGMEWEKEYQQHLESADLILLLISPDFMNLDYCYSTQMGRAIERHDQGSAVVIPILLRATLWRDAPFAKLQILPRDARPVRDRGWFDLDEAFHSITEQINILVAELRTRSALRDADEYYQSGNYTVALVSYEQVLRLDGQKGHALFGKARSLYGLGKSDESIHAFLLAEQVAPTSVGVLDYRLKAHALNQREQYLESLEAYDRALLLDPNNAEIHAERAAVLIMQQHYEQALDALELARHLEPENIAYMAQAGELLLRLGRFEQALTLYKQVSSLQLGESRHYEQQGRILLQLGRYEEALVAYRQALAITPQTQYYEQTGKICLYLDRYQEALTLYERALQTSHEDQPYLYAGKGRALLQLERYNEALVCYQTAIQLSEPETDPQFYQDLASVYEYLAQSARVLEQQRRVAWQSDEAHEFFLVPASKLTLLHTFTDHTDVVGCLAISSDGKTLLSCSNDKTIKFWDLPSGRVLRTLTGHTDGVWCIAISPDGQTLASGSEDKAIKFWEISSGRELRTLTANTHPVRYLAFTPDGKDLISSGPDKTIKVWSLPSEEEMSRLASKPDKNNVLWKLRAGQLSYHFAGFENDISSIVTSSNGRLLINSHESGYRHCTIIKVWSLPSRQELRILTGHTGYVSGLAVSPDGKLLISGGSDKTIKLWDLTSGQELRTLTGHMDVITRLALSPNGKIFISGSLDGVIKVWDVASGRELHSLTGHAGAIESLVISVNGKLLISCSDDKMIKVWRIEP